jgi:sec-independent protein translocase protein TatA
LQGKTEDRRKTLRTSVFGLSALHIYFSGFVYHQTIYNFASNQKPKEMGKIGMTEIILILLVVVLLFGGRKIPELMKGIGQGMKEFKKASKVDGETENKETVK